MPKYGNDPRWIVTKYPGKDKAGKPVPVGTRAFYFPLTRRMLTGAEAQQAARDFEAARSDESQFS